MDKYVYPPIEINNKIKTENTNKKDEYKYTEQPYFCICKIIFHFTIVEYIILSKSSLVNIYYIKKMADMFDSLFGSLGSEYCIYFYFLEVYFFISLVLFAISSLYVGFSKRKGFSYYFSKLILGLVIFFMYFQNRLLYSMCSSKR
uniref:Uncharacterized protein n=1 Tax=viral metagenome TaxID=1070528 RepID=A0A6C0DR81_9ZZZZ